MSRWVPVFALAFSISAAAADFPPSAGPEHPASDLTFAAAPEAQRGQRIASNGDVALAIWWDARTNPGQSLASRIDRDGRPMDPLGIPLGRGFAASDVVWNGVEFAVIGQDGADTRFVFVDASGAITGSKLLPGSRSFAAATTGLPLRILFREFPALPYFGTITDGRGEIVATGINLWDRPNDYPTMVVSGADSSDFLVLTASRDAGAVAKPIIVRRIGGNGTVKVTSEARLPFQRLDARDVIAGVGDGFLLVTYRNLDADVLTAAAVMAFPLEASGVFRGTATTIADREPLDRGAYGRQLAIATEPDRYVVVWNTSLYTGASYSYAAEIDRAGALVSVHRTNALGGIAYDIDLASRGGHRVVVAAANYLQTSSGIDVVSQRLSDSLDGGPVSVVAGSATLQGKVQVAVSRSGYALTWTENGPDELVRVFFRRFWFNGVPADARPIEVMRRQQVYELLYLPESRLVSDGDRYLVGWFANQWHFQRFPAFGEAIDPLPFAIEANALRLASNGIDALAVYTASCSSSRRNCLKVQRIRMTGEPLADVAWTAAQVATSPVAAASGADYLVAWADMEMSGLICGAPFPFCGGSFFRVLGTRVAASGKAVDDAPLVLAERTYATALTAAGTSAAYFVAWSSLASTAIAGVTVSREGKVNEPAVLDSSSSFATAGSHRGDFILFLSSQGTHTRRQAVRFSPSTDLASVAQLPRTELYRQIGYPLAPVTTASNDEHLVIAYDAISPPSAGSVPRAIARVFTDPMRRRTATR